MPPAAGRARAPPRDEEFVVVELGAQQGGPQQPPVDPAAAAGGCACVGVCLCGVMSAWAHWRTQWVEYAISNDFFDWD